MGRGNALAKKGVGRYPADIADDFRRVIALNSGLGTTPTLNDWTAAGTNAFGVGSDFYGLVSAGVNNTRRGGFLAPRARILDQDLTLAVSIDAVPGGTGDVEFIFCERLTAIDGDWYGVDVHFQTTGALQLHLGKRVANTDTVLDTATTVPGLTVTANRNIMVRFQTFGQATVTLRAKAWLEFDPEPAAWLVSATDTSLTAPGGIGYRLFNPSGASGTRVVKFGQLRQNSARIAA